MGKENFHTQIPLLNFSCIRDTMEYSQTPCTNTPLPDKYLVTLLTIMDISV